MLCCASKPQRRRPAAAADRLPSRPTAAAAAAAAMPPAPATADAEERQRQILVQFPGETGDREVRWAEAPARPSTMDEVRELLRQASNGSLGGVGDGGFDVLDEDGDALLAPSTWPPDTQVIVTRR